METWYRSYAKNPRSCEEFAWWSGHTTTRNMCCIQSRGGKSIDEPNVGSIVSARLDDVTLEPTARVLLWIQLSKMNCVVESQGFIESRFSDGHTVPNPLHANTLASLWFLSD